MICNHLHLQSDSLCLFSDMHCKIVRQIIPAKLKDDFLNKHRNRPLLAGKNSVRGGKFFACLCTIGQRHIIYYTLMMDLGLC